MKKLFLTVLALATLTIANAQIRLIAIKGTTTDAVAKTLDEAIEIAKAGDVIYLPGGVFTIKDTIRKPVHIIGTGYNNNIPRELPFTEIIGNIYIGKNAIGTIIEGLNIPSGGNFHIMADETILRRLKIHKEVRFKENKNCQIINCITHNIWGIKISIYNSLLGSEFHAYNSEVINCIVKQFYYSHNNIVKNTIYAYISYSTATCSNSYRNEAIYSGNKTDLKKIFKAEVNNNFFDLNNNYQVRDSIENIYPNIGIYHGSYPWKDGGQPITPHIEENNSYLDVQEQKFKLRVKVKAQTN